MKKTHSPNLAQGLFASLFALGSLTTPSHAIEVNVVFMGDTFMGQSFDGVAAQTIRKAAADVSSLITTRLNGLDYVNPNVGSTSIFRNHYSTPDNSLFVRFRLGYLNPLTGAGARIDLNNFAENEFRLFVGSRSVSGFFNTLTGQFSGTLGAGDGSTFGVSAAGAPGGQADLDELAGRISADLGRGGPGYRGDPLSLGAFSSEVSFGYFGGGLYINDNSRISWQYDYREAVGARQYDLYTVALHEILHTLGIGTTDADAWDALVTAGDPRLAPDGDHVLDPLAVMHPSISLGQRKSFTATDLGVLQDIGWSVVIPEPSASSLLLGLSTIALCFGRRSRITS